MLQLASYSSSFSLSEMRLNASPCAATNTRYLSFHQPFHTSFSLPEWVSSDVDKLDKQSIAPLCRQPLKVSPACSRLEEGRGEGELHSTLLIRTKRALFRWGGGEITSNQCICSRENLHNISLDECTKGFAQQKSLSS